MRLWRGGGDGAYTLTISPIVTVSCIASAMSSQLALLSLLYPLLQSIPASQRPAERGLNLVLALLTDIDTHHTLAAYTVSFKNVRFFALFHATRGIHLSRHVAENGGVGWSVCLFLVAHSDKASPPIR